MKIFTRLSILILIFSIFSTGCALEIRIDPGMDHHEENKREERKEEKEEDKKDGYSSCKNRCHGLTGQRRAHCNHECQGKFGRGDDD